MNKVTQEVQQQQRLDIINSFKENIEHGFDNTGGAANISGVYQYVDALYEVGIFNYGQRLLLDLIVPEPGAFIRDAITAVNSGVVTAYNPPPITFGPSQLTLPQALIPAGNNSYPKSAQWVNPPGPLPPGAVWPDAPASIDYTQAAQIYQVQGLTPPPPPTVTVAEPLNGSNPSDTDPNGIAPNTSTITIPPGYAATSAYIEVFMATLPPSRRRRRSMSVCSSAAMRTTLRAIGTQRHS